MASVTFAPASTVSSALDLTIYGETGRQRINSLVFPASWLSATVTVQSSSDLGNTYQTVYLPGGTAYSFTAAPSSEVTLDMGIFSDLTNVKFVSSVSQTATPVVTVILVDADHASSLGGELSSGGGSGSNASVGATGTTAPTSATEVAYVNAGGNLTAVSPSNPLPVTGGAASVGSALYATTATVGTTAAALPSNTLVTGANIYNPVGNQVVYAGPSGVTTATGFPIFPGGAPISLPVNNTNLIYLISGTAGQVVNYVAI